MLHKKIIIILSILLTMIPGCKKSEIVPGDPAGLLINHNGCKEDLLSQASTAGKNSTGIVRECLEFRYNGEKTLEIDHINALFNCCPGEITANFEFDGNTIIITEKQAEAGCHCICHFDVNFHFDNIPPAVYTIRVFAADSHGEDREFSIDLTSNQSGSQCWDSPYPGEWSQK